MTARVAGDATCPCLVCTWVAQLEVLLSSSPWRLEGATVVAHSTDVPEPSGQQLCRLHPEHGYKLHAEAIRGCTSLSDCTIILVMCAHSTGGGVLCMWDARVPALHARKLTREGCRGCPVLRGTCEHSDTRLPAGYAGFGDYFLRTQQAHTNTRPLPARGWTGGTCWCHALPSYPWTSRVTLEVTLGYIR